jgi:hypothetical protein
MYTQQQVFVMLVLLASAESRRQQNWHGKYLLRVYSVGVLLMMDSRHVRNM